MTLDENRAWVSAWSAEEYWRQSCTETTVASRFVEKESLKGSEKSLDLGGNPGAQVVCVVM